MQRHAEEFLHDWLVRKNRKPLIIRGARQVGKSTLIRNFAKLKKIKLLELNLEKEKLKSIRRDSISIEEIINEIQAHFNESLTPNTLIFFDEIQKQPDLIPVLRYFYEERPDIPIIAAGSLLEFVLEKHKFEMPVGRIEYFHLGPMSFFEFLLALKKNKLLEQIKTNLIQSDSQFSQAQHDQLTTLFQNYIFIGGMPEAIKTYIESNDPLQVRAVHRNIVQTYKDDFPKYATQSQYEDIQKIFEKTAEFIGKKTKYSEFSNELNSREIKKSLGLLRLARILHFCYHSNCSGLPLNSQKDESVFKIYFLDIGLLNYLRGLSWQQAQEFSNSTLLTKGEIAEQFVAQHLAYRDQGLEAPNLFYWLRDKKKQNAEVDFVVEYENAITAIEIKAGESGSLKSLVQFIFDKNLHQAFRFDLKFRKNTCEKVQHKMQVGNLIKIVKFNLKSYHLSLIEQIFRR